MSSVIEYSKSDDAFDALVQTDYKRISKLTLRMMRNQEDAEDATQEAYLLAYKSYGRLRTEGAGSTYLYRIAINVSHDAIRKRNKTPQTYLIDAPIDGKSSPQERTPDTGLSPEEQVLRSEGSKRVLRAVDSLREDYRTVILLHHVEDMRIEDIAEMINVMPGTIKSRLNRARKELKQKLLAFDREYDDPPHEEGFALNASHMPKGGGRPSSLRDQMFDPRWWGIMFKAIPPKYSLGNGEYRQTPVAQTVLDELAQNKLILCIQTIVRAMQIATDHNILSRRVVTRSDIRYRYIAHQKGA